jgi:hypothetical protein
MEGSVSKKSDDEMTDVERMRHWIDIVDGKIDLGRSEIASVKESKSGQKLTIKLKKPKTVAKLAPVIAQTPKKAKKANPD